MKQDIEALLFSTDAPLTAQRLKGLLGDEVDGKEIREAIDALNQEYEAQDRAFAIVEFGGGWQLASRPEYMPLIQKLYKGRRYVRLSRAALEVLAIVAYRQPVTRMEIEDVRGVQVSGVLQTLTERNLVTVVGRSDAVGNPILYGTTREFLNHMGLKGLHQLPSLPELEGIIQSREEIKEFAAQLGEEIFDEDFETVDVRGDEIILVKHEPEAEAAPAEEAPAATDAEADAADTGAEADATPQAAAAADGAPDDDDQR
ncbi:MAG TPA: SMC-Scp complex subunit ScpB [Candidatus Krumholzibacteria bacterium]|nr:SMC-Scp complex subunit ScpB [Candidatus Krumholzibacteria bacterium]HRX52042.1 SMC-Scp complex subunit ScpB [Candidatus Krumholzibacteria bacterium]